MRTSRQFALMLAVASSLAGGCGRMAGKADIAVIDLAATAKATGQDKVMAQQVEAARNELDLQLKQIAGDLEKKLQTEQSRLGGAAAASKDKEFQQLTAQARQQLAQTQAMAQQKAQEFQLGVVTQFRQTVQAIAAKIATSNGASVVLVADPEMLWFKPELDITGQVIAELRAEAAIPAKPAAGDSSGKPPSGG